jgi:hypothetical protein
MRNTHAHQATTDSHKKRTEELKQPDGAADGARNDPRSLPAERRQRSGADDFAKDVAHVAVRVPDTHHRAALHNDGESGGVNNGKKNTLACRNPKTSESSAKKTTNTERTVLWPYQRLMTVTQAGLKEEEKRTK